MSDPLAIVRRRLRAQRLTGPPLATPAAAVAWSGAVQAQELAEAKWSLAERVAGDPTDADVEAAYARGEILRTHVLRPTWHFVAAEDLRWLLRLSAPRVQAGNASYHRKWGLTPAVLARVLEVTAATLADGDPRTRPELAAALRVAGPDLEGLPLAYAVMHAELEGLVASGPRRGSQHTYLLLEGRVPPAPRRPREDDVLELALRYFTSHGPATPKDFSWWSGLTLTDARAGVARAGARLVTETGEDGVGQISAPGTTEAAAAGAFLLGSYDEAVVAYRELKVVLAEPPPGEGLLVRPILLDGRTVGSWRRTLTRRAVAVEAMLFTGLDATGLEALGSPSSASAASSAGPPPSRSPGQPQRVRRAGASPGGTTCS